MLIGTQYADNKMYRGIKHYDSLPLTSGDLHEFSDTIHMKNAIFMNNLLGSGTLNKPKCTISSSGIYLDSPSAILVDGDIALIQSDSDQPIISLSEINDSGIADGLLCVVGWYQSLTSSSTLRNYGGVRNSVLANDLTNTALGIQISTRYQFRWDIVLVDKSNYNSDSMTISILNRDSTGEKTTGSTTITTTKSNNIRVANKPSTMTYAESNLYILPILSFTYENSTITTASAYTPLKAAGGNNFIQSSTEPTGTYEEGTIWFDTTTYRFKFYVPNLGFVSTAQDIALMQYNNTVTISAPATSPTNISVAIGINSFSEGDILQVIYEGVLLTQDVHYTVDIPNKRITLLGFTTNPGDIVTFLVMKLVDTSDAVLLVQEFNEHINNYGNATEKGHVKLSDSIDSTLDATSNTAATPKSVYESKLIYDSDTGIKYKFIVSNSILYLEEV